MPDVSPNSKSSPKSKADQGVATLMNKLWPPSKSDIKKSLLIFVGSVLVMGVAVCIKEFRQGGEFEPAKLALRSLFVGGAMWLSMHLFIILPLRIVPLVSSMSDERGRVSGNPRRGAWLVRSGFWIYTILFLVNEVRSISQSEGSRIGWRVFFGIIFLWILFMAARGIKGMRDLVAYMLILSFFVYYKLPALATDGVFGNLYLAQLSIGVLLGLILLFSKDAACHLALQYEKIPLVTRRKLEKKKSR